MFKIVMIIAIALLVVGWIAYGIYEYKLREEEKKHPRKPSERLQKTRGEVADWARKMAQYQPPKRKKPGQDNQQETKETST